MSKKDRSELAKKHIDRQRREEDREWQRAQHRRKYPELYEE